MQPYLTNRVAFVGEIGSGKTFTGNWLSKNYNYKIFSFAKGLKDIAREYYNMKNKDRLLLQNLGDAMRSVDEDVFVKKTLRDIEEYEKQNENSRIVIDDLRFFNEYNAIKNIQGSEFTIIRIKTTKKSETQKKGQNHYSEQQACQLDAQYEINSGDFDGLILILSN